MLANLAQLNKPVDETHRHATPSAESAGCCSEASTNSSLPVLLCRLLLSRFCESCYTAVAVLKGLLGLQVGCLSGKYLFQDEEWFF